jgi:hypothetical protein
MVGSFPNAHEDLFTVSDLLEQSPQCFRLSLGCRKALKRENELQDIEKRTVGIGSKAETPTNEFAQRP